MMKALPKETVIQFSKWKIIWFVAMVFVIIGGIASLIQGGSILKHIMAIICVLVGATLAYFEYWNLIVLNKPQLVISDKGFCKLTMVNFIHGRSLAMKR